MTDEACATCSTRPADPAHYYFRREFCSAECRAEFIRPVVGKAATYCIGSDRYPCTIVAVSKTGAKLTLREDRWLGEGKFEAATGRERTAHRNGDGGYNVGRSGDLTIGVRDAYRDPSF